ncbi:MAG TPA: DUF3093 domain-containing protein [Nocardioidaceae bacterium]|nr:DUF3093 domain-containing protein [Nocardioidaceae bacterium]
MTTSTSYDERLGVPLRWWALATMFLASVLLAFLVALPAPVAFGTVGLMVAGVVALFLGYGAAQVSVRDGELLAGAARIPVELLADPVALDDDATKRAMGVDANARAYLLVRPYLRRSVKVTVIDPDDPTPYWLVSTRHPRTLAAAVADAIAEAGH